MVWREEAEGFGRGAEVVAVSGGGRKVKERKAELKLKPTT
jgi:hypothetical protein